VLSCPPWRAPRQGMCFLLADDDAALSGRTRGAAEGPSRVRQEGICKMKALCFLAAKQIVLKMTEANPSKRINLNILISSISQLLEESKEDTPEFNMNLSRF